jgi:serine/threonine-protein kinase
MMAHLSEMPPAVVSVRPEVPQALDAVVMKCLAKRPEDRFASAAELERTLAAVA